MREPPEVPGHSSMSKAEGYNNTHRGFDHHNNFGNVENGSVE